MIPIRLEMQAFGPFLEKQVIEFEPFRQTGLFLIYGRTGAGKTSIFDAITYALFGRSSGDGRGDITKMRCNLASDDKQTRVLFDFALGSRQYRFERGVSAHKKRSGEIELRTLQAAYYKEGDRFVPFFENPTIGKVRDKAVELLGLSYEQFRQVALLPQGQFEKLLTADAAGKEQVLETLFGARKWQAISDILCGWANEMKREKEMLGASAAQTLQRFGCEDEQAFAAHCRKLAQEREALTQQSTAAAEEEKRAADALAAARVIEGQFAEERKLCAEEKQLQAGAEDIRDKGEFLKKVIQAQKLAPLQQAARKLRSESAGRREQIEKLQTQIGALNTQRTRLAEEMAALRGVLRKRKEESEVGLVKAQAQAGREQETLDKMRAAYMENAAYVLAQTLEDGQPCPVCGSTQHTAVQAHKSDVSQEAVSAQEKKLDMAKGKALSLEKELEADIRGMQEHMRLLQKYNVADVSEGATAGGRDGGEIAAEMDKLEIDRAGLAAGLGQQQAEQARLQEEYESALAEYAQKSKEAGFESDGQVKQYLIDEAEKTKIEDEIKAYEVRVAVNGQALRKVRAALENVHLPDMAALQGAQSAAAEQNGALSRKLGEVSARLADAQKEYEKIVEMSGRLMELTEEYIELDGFAKLLRGDGGVGLKRYVLGVMLSAIAAQANELLKKVHDGRYRLYRTDESEGRAKKAGLDLVVYDAYAGERRGVGSLSGGEKFLVALALSLGLCAVLQAQSGGIHIDTMFIDEGFGSLDPASINDALDMLAAVKGSSRLIGIISHVQSLRESIETAIEVKKGREGSRVILRV